MAVQDQESPIAGNNLLVKVGPAVSRYNRRELQIITAQAKVIENVHIYGCRHCEREEVTASIVPAPMPAPVIPGSLASPSAVSYVMTQKFVEGMLLYRQSSSSNGSGSPSLARPWQNWMLIAADRWLCPVY